MKRWLSLVLLMAAAATVSASPITLSFSASGFVNAGVQKPGFDEPVQGTISWEANQPSDPIANLLSIDLTIAGHAYSLAEVGLGPSGSTSSVIGGAAHGFNAVVGDGAANDFMFVFDRVTPNAIAFAYAIAGQAGAIWWTPARMEAHFVTDDNPPAQVPEPASIWLAAAALLALFSASRLTARSGCSLRG